jgi:hypothetical protein
MSKLGTSLILSAALSFAAISVYADDNAQPAAQDQATPVATATTTATTPAAPVAKVAKVAPKAVAKVAVELDIDAINKATQKDLQKAVSVRLAKHIIAARTKVGGQFADQQQFNKEVKITKKQMAKLAKVFAKANAAAVK